MSLLTLGGTSGGASPSRPTYSLLVLSADGTLHGTLANFFITQITDELNNFGSCVFTVPTREPSLSLLAGKITEREIQVWRTPAGGAPKLIWWGVVVRARATAQSVEFQCQGILWYLSRLHVGPMQFEHVTNGAFESGTTGWTAVGCTQTADTTIVRQGTYSLKLVSSAEGLDQYSHQTFSITAPSTGLILMLAASYYQVATVATPYIGPAFEERGLHVIVRNGGGSIINGPALLGEWTPLSEAAVRNQWGRIFAPPVLIPGSTTCTVEVRLYSPGGEIHWDLCTGRENENLSQLDPAHPTDPTADARHLLANMLAVIDPSLNKPALHINPPTVDVGYQLTRVYRNCDLAEMWSAVVGDLVSSGICDVGIVWPSDGSSRQLVAWASRGNDHTSDLPLDLSTNIADFSWDEDGQQTASSVVVEQRSTQQEPTLGTVQQEAVFFGWAYDLSANDGITLDTVETMAVETVPDGIQTYATTRLALTKNPVTVPTVTVVDTPGSTVVGVLGVGDLVKVTVPWGFVNEAGTTWRVTAWTLTPEKETLQLTLGNPLAGKHYIPPPFTTQITAKAAAIAEINRTPNPLPPHFAQVGATDLNYITNAQTPTYDSATGQLVATDPADIPFSYPGPLTTSTSPPITPKNTINATGLSVTLGTAGSTTTTVHLLKNGSSVATVTLASSVTYAHVAISPAVTFTGRTDTYAISVTPGTGAADMGGGIELG